MKSIKTRAQRKHSHPLHFKTQRSGASSGTNHPLLKPASRSAQVVVVVRGACNGRNHNHQPSETNLPERARYRKPALAQSKEIINSIIIAAPCSMHTCTRESISQYRIQYRSRCRRAKSPARALFSRVRSETFRHHPFKPSHHHPTTLPSTPKHTASAT